ncbi:hypothetical protein ACYSNO_00585 [Enterococcus sp. LJL98]
MKKIFQVSILVFAVSLLGACSTSKETKSDASTTPISTTEEEVRTIFTATVELVTNLDDKNETTQILLKDVQSVEDPDEVTPSFQEGVALNVSPELLDFDVKEGDQVKVTLDRLAIMTMSIPPQIPGNSIIAVEQVK